MGEKGNPQSIHFKIRFRQYHDCSQPNPLKNNYLRFSMSGVGGRNPADRRMGIVMPSLPSRPIGNLEL
ncbi:hypothetical protein AJ87_37455 [Rhizobium yanglingense]|nr:hypothetical protein AJ87_37455 [Rhizobium yanglingense]